MAASDKDLKSDQDKLALREVDGWNYTAASLIEEDDEICTLNLNRPVALVQRLDLVKNYTKFPHLNPNIFNLSERYLSPRQPYQSSPLSYLNAVGRSWTLECESDTLLWPEFSNVNPRPGALEFWFRNVVADRMALVTLKFTTWTGDNDATGSFDVGWSATPTRNTFSVTGYRENLIDVIVRPTNTWGVLVGVTIGPGIQYFVFKSATYQTL